MEEFISYILKSSIWLTLFGLVYFIFLRNERYFFLNRLFLLTGMVASLLFPLITFTQIIIVDGATDNVSTSVPIASQVTEKELNPLMWQNILAGLIITGALYFFFKIVFQTIKILKSIRQSRIDNIGSTKIVKSNHFPFSFSFFTYVFVNPSLKEKEIQEIVAHERAHIAQYHWIDLVLIELIRMIQWMNPMAWLYSHFIRQNHEYLADRSALKSTFDPAFYKAILINQLVGGEVISLGHPFSYSLNKKRFIMMTNKSTSIIRKMKPLIVFPLIAIVFYAFSEPKYQYQPVQDENADASLSPKNGDETKNVTGIVVQENGQPLHGTSIIVSGTTTGTISDKNGSFKLNNIGKNSELVFSFVGYKTVKISPEFRKRMEITMKKDTVEKDTGVTVIAKNDNTGEMPIVMVDGNEKPYKIINTIAPEDIESIEVLKGASAAETYGEKARNGIILITTKPSYKPSNEPVVNTEKNSEKSTSGKANQQKTKEGEPVFFIVEEMPNFPGGDRSLHNYIAENTKYPPEAKEQGIEGRVYISFIISPEGKPGEIKVARGVHPLLDGEAKRVIATMPDWEPGKQRGKSVSVHYTLPINFQLSDKEEVTQEKKETVLH